MPDRRYTVLPALALALIVMAALVVPASAAVSVGDKAPNFTLDSVDGKSTLKLSDYTGKPTLLVFWASWCPHCQREAPLLQGIYRDLAAKGMNAIGVSADDTIGDAQDYVQSYGLTFPNAFAGTTAGQQVLSTYGLQGVPTIYIIDKDGVVRDKFMGETSADTIKQALARLGVK